MSLPKRQATGCRGAFLKNEKLRVLELIRHRLEVDRLIAAALERGATARYRKA
jgi:hypothetical protein